MGRLEEIEKFFFGDKLSEDVDEPSWLKDMQLAFREIHRLRVAIKNHKQRIKYLCKAGNFPINAADEELYKALEEE